MDLVSTLFTQGWFESTSIKCLLLYVDYYADEMDRFELSIQIC
jgi:hypothetical protein